jgi:serine/threonine-protein kinase
MDLKLQRGTWIQGAPIPGGEGSYGAIFEVRAQDGTEAVAKRVIKMPGAQRELLIGDSNTADEYRNVVPILDSGEHNGDLVLIMPRAEKSLAERLEEQGGVLDLAEAVSVLTDIATALSDIDGQVVHRDLKPANILLLDGTWCIADFGIARYAEASTSSETRKRVFTSAYAAPEQWAFERATSATDIYAFGVIGYQLIDGVLPFTGPTDEDFRFQHTNTTPPGLQSGTPRLAMLIEECLYKSPELRPLAGNVLARLENAVQLPGSAGRSRLAQVSQTVTQHRAQAQAEQLTRASQDQRRTQMFSDATHMFDALVNPLVEAIEQDAPAATVERNVPNGNFRFVASLSEGLFKVSQPEQPAPWSGPFTVIASAEIVVRLKTFRSDWQGRSHSLWFCDAQDEGRFAWYETAFMATPLTGRNSPEEPGSLQPAVAAEAVNPGIGTVQVAWPFEELDRADLSEFIDRWIGWFADAAAGDLSKPSTMPEKDVRGTWRT